MGKQSRLNKARRQVENRTNTVKRVKIIGRITRQIPTDKGEKIYKIQILEEGNEITNALLRNSINIEIPDNTKIVLGLMIQTWNNDEFPGVCFIHNIRYKPFESCYEYDYTPWSGCVHDSLHPDLVTLTPDLTMALADYVKDFVTKKYYAFL